MFTYLSLFFFLPEALPTTSVLLCMHYLPGARRSIGGNPEITRYASVEIVQYLDVGTICSSHAHPHPP